MRVLTVANHLGSRGGLERTQMTTCRGLARRGERVDVVYVSAGDFYEDWRAFAGSMAQIAGTLPRRRSPAQSGAGVLRGLLVGRRLQPDVVYVYRYWDLPYAIGLRALTGAPVVFHLCLPPPKRIPRWLAAALGRVDRTLSVSRDTAERWTGSGLDPARTSVVLTGVDLDRYRPADEADRRATRAEHGLGPEHFVVLYAGRIDREKGVDVLIRAFHHLGERHADARLVVVGSPSLGADPRDSVRYQAELASLAEGHAVTILPGRPDVVPLLQCADVAVVPSLWPEPLSRALMEPLACGVPVVASDAGGNPEILTGWLAEWLVPTGDDGALAGALTALHDWRSRDPGLGARCRQHAEQALALDVETDAVDRALQEAASTRRRRRAARRSASATERASCG